MFRRSLNSVLLLTFLFYVNNCDKKTYVEEQEDKTDGKAVSSVTAEGAKMQKLAGGFSFTEGPAHDKDGNIFFTDIPNNRIHKWSLTGELSTFADNTGGANGLFFTDDGDLLACAGGIGKVVYYDKEKNVHILADTYNGKGFNSPNDLWIDNKGGVYFTDPSYGSRENLPQDGECVYYIKPDRKEILRVIDDMVRPNGIIGTPDGKKLYIADHGDGKTFVCDIQEDGTIINKKLFIERGSDGMTIDTEGNIYLTTDAVEVYSPEGKLIEKIIVPEHPANVSFGGTDKNILFITARTSLYSIDMRVKGIL